MSELDFYIIISESYKQNLFYADFLNSLTLLDTDSTAAMQPVSRKRMCLNYFIFLKYIEQMCSQKIMGLGFFLPLEGFSRLSDHHNILLYGDCWGLEEVRLSDLFCMLALLPRIAHLQNHK